MSTPEFDRIYRTVISDWLFDGVDASDSPIAVLIGGQPGAGKSSAQSDLVRELGPEQTAIINGDELRPFHPQFNEWSKLQDLQLVALTGNASGKWVQQAIDDGIQRRVNLVIEGTFRRPSITLETAQLLHENGYQVRVVAMAVASLTSRLSVIERYLQSIESQSWGRWCTRSAHDEAYDAMIDTVRHAVNSSDVDSVIIRRRDHPTIITSDRTKAVKAMLKERDAEWQDEQKVAHLSSLGWVIAQMKRRPVLGEVQTTVLDLIRDTGSAFV